MVFALVLRAMHFFLNYTQQFVVVWKMLCCKIHSPTFNLSIYKNDNLPSAIKVHHIIATYSSQLHCIETEFN